MIFDYWAITVCGISFQKFNLIINFVTLLDKSTLSPYNPARQSLYTFAHIQRMKDGLGFFLFARRY